MTSLTDRQQLDMLWEALQSMEFWVNVNLNGVMTLHRPGEVDITTHILAGSRQSIIERLFAMKVADRLEGKQSGSLRNIEPEPRTEFDLPSWTPADRNRNNRR